MTYTNTTDLNGNKIILDVEGNKITEDLIGKPLYSEFSIKETFELLIIITDDVKKISDTFKILLDGNTPEGQQFNDAIDLISESFDNLQTNLDDNMIEMKKRSPTATDEQIRKLTDSYAEYKNAISNSKESEKRLQDLKSKANVDDIKMLDNNDLVNTVKMYFELKNKIANTQENIDKAQENIYKAQEAFEEANVAADKADKAFNEVQLAYFSNQASFTDYNQALADKNNSDQALQTAKASLNAAIETPEKAKIIIEEQKLIFTPVEQSFNKLNLSAEQLELIKAYLDNQKNKENHTNAKIKFDVANSGINLGMFDTLMLLIQTLGTTLKQLYDNNKIQLVLNNILKIYATVSIIIKDILQAIENIKQSLNVNQLSEYLPIYHNNHFPSINRDRWAIWCNSIFIVPKYTPVRKNISLFETLSIKDKIERVVETII